jgi:hypothetical protein
MKRLNRNLASFFTVCVAGLLINVTTASAQLLYDGVVISGGSDYPPYYKSLLELQLVLSDEETVLRLRTDSLMEPIQNISFSAGAKGDKIYRISTKECEFEVTVAEESVPGGSPVIPAGSRIYVKNVSACL